MMRFDEAVDLNLGRALKKIRIKVDPIYSSYTNFRNVNSYEGYIVMETREMLQIMVIKPGLPVVMIPKVGLLSDEKLNMFKEYLVNKLKLEKGTPLYEQILNSNHLEDVEVFLKQDGKQDIDIVEIYRDFILNNEKN